jgi:hypothetical protein
MPPIASSSLVSSKVASVECIQQTRKMARTWAENNSMWRAWSTVSRRQLSSVRLCSIFCLAVLRLSVLLAFYPVRVEVLDGCLVGMGWDGMGWDGAL